MDKHVRDPRETQSEQESQESYDWPQLIEELNRRLKLPATPIGMKWFRSVEEM